MPGTSSVCSEYQFALFPELGWLSLIPCVSPVDLSPFSSDVITSPIQLIFHKHSSWSVLSTRLVAHTNRKAWRWKEP